MHLPVQYGTSVGSRLYLLDDRSDSRYKIFHLKNREFTMDVVSMHALSVLVPIFRRIP